MFIGPSLKDAIDASVEPSRHHEHPLRRLPQRTRKITRESARTRLLIVIDEYAYFSAPSATRTTERFPPDRDCSAGRAAASSSFLATQRPIHRSSTSSMGPVRLPVGPSVHTTPAPMSSCQAGAAEGYTPPTSTRLAPASVLVSETGIPRRIKRFTSRRQIKYLAAYAAAWRGKAAA